MPTKKPKSRVRSFRIPIERGMWSGGDAMLIPEGFLRKVRNLFRRAGVWAQRPQFTYESLTAIRGLANWEDSTNKVTRLVSIDSSGNLKAKGTSGETWGSAATGTVGGTRLTSATNFRGVLYGMQDNGSGLPSATFMYDGSAVTGGVMLGYDDGAIPDYTGLVFSADTGIAARAVVAWKERLWFLGPRATFKNRLGNGAGSDKWSKCYPVDTAWAETNCVLENITIGSTVTYRVTTQSLTAAKLSSVTGVGGWAGVAACDTSQPIVAAFEFQNPTASFDVPVTIVAYYLKTVVVSTAYAVGDVVTVGGVGTGYLHECVTAGTTTNPTPSYTVTVGNTTTDGSAVFRNIGSHVLQTTASTIPVGGEWTRVISSITVPKVNTFGYVWFEVRFYSDDVPTLTENVTLNVAYKDGATDGAVGKKNHGWQVTHGAFIYPFGNLESDIADTEATVDLPELMWSEIGRPKLVRAANSYDMTGLAGDPVAEAIIGGQLVTFKRRSAIAFGATDDPDIPVLPVGDERLFGCLNPKAIDVFEDYGYFVGENEVYRWRPGMDAPDPLLGDAMRDEVMARDTTTTTTGNGVAFTNQPANDGVEILSSSAADTTQTVTIIGTTTATDTVVVETKTLTGTSVVSTTKTDWGVILAVKLSAACAGTVTVREASGDATIITLTAGQTSKGVETVATAQQSSYNGLVKFVASGATTKQIGVGGTNPAGTAIYDSQALTGATAAWSNSIFFTVTELYTGDLESNRTVTETAYSWCEDQAGSVANRALLAIDQKEREVWVYTQNGRLYVYDIDDKAWSAHDAGGGTGINPYGYPVCDMAYNPNTQRMYFAFAYAPAGTAGLARLDPTVAEAEDSISSSGTSTVISELWLKPLELFTPFFELMIERIRLKLRVTDSQTSQTLTAYVSKDQGVTWPKSNQVVISPLATDEYKRGRITLWQKGLSLMVRLLKSGKGGADNFAVSHVEADVQVLQGEYPRDQFTAGSATL